jgi:hypothetical protein
LNDKTHQRHKLSRRLAVTVKFVMMGSMVDLDEAVSSSVQRQWMRMKNYNAKEMVLHPNEKTVCMSVSTDKEQNDVDEGDTM